MITKIQINSLLGNLLFEYECENNTIKKTVEEAVKNSADLSFANLSFANLSFANLSFTNLSSADLSSADLRSADLSSADLSSADLSSANLRFADLSFANLSFTNLSSAKNWQETEWAYQCKQNILFVLSYLKSEVPHLKEMLLAGKINGTQYEGDCTCLIGSLGKQKGVDNVCSVIPFYRKGLHNFGEQLFYQIIEGNTPDNSEFSKLAVELCDMVLDTNN